MTLIGVTEAEVFEFARKHNIQKVVTATGGRGPRYSDIESLVAAVKNNIGLITGDQNTFRVAISLGLGEGQIEYVLFGAPASVKRRNHAKLLRFVKEMINQGVLPSNTDPGKLFP